jgi:phosphatidylinositol 3-kinase
MFFTVSALFTGLVQINTSGQMFHIDFGFIFGQDPKPMPPPFRFIRAMADAMGGEDGENYGRFKTFCCQVRPLLHLLS